mgnify:CR=1 FL=1
MDTKHCALKGQEARKNPQYSSGDPIRSHQRDGRLGSNPSTFYYRFEAISGEHYSWGYFSREDMKETIMEILKIYERISREKQEMISEDREFTNEELKLGE